PLGNDQLERVAAERAREGRAEESNQAGKRLFDDVAKPAPRHAAVNAKDLLRVGIVREVAESRLEVLREEQVDDVALIANEVLRGRAAHDDTGRESGAAAWIAWSRSISA